MKINEILTEEEAPILPKRVTDKELVALLGKGKTNAMLRHPWFQRYSNYQKAYRYAKDKWGFVTVDMFPYFVEHNRTPDGGIRPTIYVSFIFSYSGTKVVQAHQFTRPMVPDEFELNNKITGGWQHGVTWKVDKKDVRESINPDILDTRFSHTQEIGAFTYTAKTVAHKFNGKEKPPLFVVTCYDGSKEVGSATFYTSFRNCLVSQLTSVDPRYQRKGIASTMYAYARMLGNTIEPSGHQLRPGKNMWRSWRNRGDAEHLTTEDETYQPPALHTGDKILKGKFKNSPAEITGFKKDKHNQPVLKTNKGDVALFKPRIAKLSDK